MFGCHYCYHLFKYMPWWAGLIWVDWNGSCHFATICSCLLYRNFELIGVLSKLQKKFEFWTSKAGWRVYSGFRTKVVRGNRVSSSFQKSSGHNFSGKYFLGTRIQLHKLQTKRPRWTALSEKNRRSVLPFPLLYFVFPLTFSVSVFGCHYFYHLFKSMPWWQDFWIDSSDSWHCYYYLCLLFMPFGLIEIHFFAVLRTNKFLLSHCH